MTNSGTQAEKELTLRRRGSTANDKGASRVRAFPAFPGVYRTSPVPALAVRGQSRRSRRFGGDSNEASREG
mgnify:CR=1 FL=1